MEESQRLERECSHIVTRSIRYQMEDLAELQRVWAVIDLKADSEIFDRALMYNGNRLIATP